MQIFLVWKNKNYRKPICILNKNQNKLNYLKIMMLKT